MQSGPTTPDVSVTRGLGRVLGITSASGRTIVTVNGPDGLRDLALPVAPDRAAAVVAASGLWRLQWVRIHLDVASPMARLAGTTRHPHVRAISLSAALSLADQGVPAFVVTGAGD